MNLLPLDAFMSTGVQYWLFKTDDILLEGAINDAFTFAEITGFWI